MERLADNKIDKENLLISSMRGIHMVPMDIIGGFEVRPGMYEMNGAAAIPCGVNFTVYSSGATSCELFLFNKDNYLLDIYAKAVNGQRIWGVKKDDKICYKARVVKDDFDWGKSRNLLISMEDLIIYEMHVRGFSKHESSGVKHPGTFEGLREKIPYLKELGVNVVELMPIFEFDEMMDYREKDRKPLLNYWGYNTVSFCMIMELNAFWIEI